MKCAEYGQNKPNRHKNSHQSKKALSQPLLAHESTSNHIRLGCGVHRGPPPNRGGEAAETDAAQVPKPRQMLIAVGARPCSAKSRPPFASRCTAPSGGVGVAGNWVVQPRLAEARGSRSLTASRAPFARGGRLGSATQQPLHCKRRHDRHRDGLRAFRRGWTVALHPLPTFDPGLFIWRNGCEPISGGRFASSAMRELALLRARRVLRTYGKTLRKDVNNEIFQEFGTA